MSREHLNILATLYLAGSARATGMIQAAVIETWKIIQGENLDISYYLLSDSGHTVVSQSLQY